MKVTIKEDCKSVLLDNGIEPPMLMDIEKFIYMAIESRNEMADKLQQAEAQVAKMRGAIDYAINRLDNTQYNDCVGVAASRHWIKKVCQEALVADSGAALLKELEGLRKVKAAIIELRVWEKAPCPYCDSSEHDGAENPTRCTCFDDGKILKKLDQALAELEKEVD